LYKKTHETKKEKIDMHVLWYTHTHENTIPLKYACCGTHTLTFSAIGFKNRINGYDLFICLFVFGGVGGGAKTYEQIYGIKSEMTKTNYR
jgi:hypothetical protein